MAARDPAGALRSRPAGREAQDLAPGALRPRRLELRLLRHDGGRLTLDHVVPRSRGGESVWENVVTSCAPCNLRKGDKLLEHTHMVLTRRPRPPAPVLFIRLAAPKIPVGWEPYLSRYGELTSHAA